MGSHKVLEDGSGRHWTKALLQRAKYTWQLLQNVDNQLPNKDRMYKTHALQKAPFCSVLLRLCSKDLAIEVASILKERPP
eukprot:3682437-Amphidinium_carterae.1